MVSKKAKISWSIYFFVALWFSLILGWTFHWPINGVVPNPHLESDIQYLQTTHQYGVDPAFDVISLPRIIVSVIIDLLLIYGIPFGIWFWMKRTSKPSIQQIRNLEQ